MDMTMLGNLLDTLPAAEQRQDAVHRNRSGISPTPGGGRFADHLSQEQQRHARAPDQPANPRQTPAAGNTPASMDPGRGKPLPPAARESRSVAIEAPSADRRATDPNASDAELARDLDQRAHNLRAADDSAPVIDAPELARLLGQALGGAEAEPEVESYMDEALASDSTDHTLDAKDSELPVTALELLAQYLSGNEEIALSADQMPRLQPADTETTAEWLENLTDEELATVWLATLTGQEHAVSEDDIPVLLAETQARPDFMALAQLDPDWVKIDTPDPEHLQPGSEQAVVPGLLQDDTKPLTGVARANSESEPELELGNAKDTPVSDRARLAQLTEALQARVDRDAGRGSDELGALRQSLDSQTSREATRQTVAELVKQHVERQIPVKNSASELTQRLSERMVMMIGQDIQEARIRLNPPEMGHLDVRVTTQNDQVHVHVIAQQPMVRDLLEQHAHRLREMLEQQGFTQVNVDVSDQGGSGEQAQGSDQTGEEMADEVGADAGTVAPARQAVGLVDHYV